LEDYMRFKIKAITRSQPAVYILVLEDGQTGRMPSQAVPVRLKVGDTGVVYTDERGRQRVRLDALDADYGMDYNIGS
jgi:hypothetical protein